MKVTLSTTELILLLLKEIHGPEWFKFLIDDIWKSLEQFWISVEQPHEDTEGTYIDAKAKASFLPKPHDTLMRRSRRQRLTYQEKFHIFTRHVKEGESVRQLWAEYQICRGTISRILHEFKSSECRWTQKINKIKRHLKTSPMIIEKIAAFKRNWNIPFVIKDVIEYI